MQIEQQGLEKYNEAQAASNAEQMQILQKEWGAGFDKNIESAKLGARDLGFDLEQDKPYFNDAEFIMGMQRHASAISEDHLRRGESEFGGADSNKLAAQDIITNPQNVLYAKYHAGDERTIARVRALNQG